MDNNKTKKVKKRIKLKIFPIFIVILVGVLFYFLYLFLLSVPIKNIYVSGNMLLSDYQIIEMAGLNDYPSFLKTSNKSISSKLESSSYIFDVSVKKGFFNIIYLSIEENIPFFLNMDDKLVLSDGNEVTNDYNVCVPTLVNYVPDTKYEELINKISKIDKNIWNHVSEIKYEPTDQDKDRFGLYMNDGNLIYLTLTKFDKLNYYNDIINEFSCKKGILNLDSGNHFEVKIDKCE